MIRVQIESDPELVSPVKDECSSILKTVFADQNITDADLTLVFGNDELLAKLKKKYFGKDYLTDVIAFRLNEDSEQQVEGEIYISLPRAKENAKQFHEPFEREITRLIIHGALHLIGYRDNTSGSKNEMTELEEKYLDTEIWKIILLSTNEMKYE